MMTKKKTVLTYLLCGAGICAAVFGMMQATKAVAVEGADWYELIDTLQGGGYYRMTGDIEAPHDGTVELGADARLDLNGYILDISGERSEEEDLFSITGSLAVESSQDSGTAAVSSGRSLFGVNGGKLSLDRVYAYGYNVDHIIYSDGGTVETSGGKLFGLTTGNGNGGGLCLMNGSSAQITGGIMSQLAGSDGGGVYADETSALRMDKNVIIENCYAAHQGGGIYADMVYDNLSAFLEDSEKFTVRDCTASHGFDKIRAEAAGNDWDELKGTVALGGTYRLTDDIDVVETSTVRIPLPDGAINLNGHVCAVSGSTSHELFNISKDGSLSITDDQQLGGFEYTGGHTLVTNNGLFTVDTAVLTGDNCHSLLKNLGESELNDAVLRAETASGHIVDWGLILNSGTLTTNGYTEITGARTTSGNGGGICCESDASVIVLNDHTRIADCSVTSSSTLGTKNNGGGIYARGTVEMNDNATIDGCYAKGHGGGISMMVDRTDGKPNAVITMNGSSKIINCSTATGGFGGAVQVEADGSLTMNEHASIEKSTSGYGGGISNSGIVAMNGDSSISGCTATTRGGAVSNGGKMTMQDNALITGCKAQLGGGISNNNVGELSVKSKAHITQNTATRYGGGVQNIKNAAQTTVYGAEAVTNNTPDNIYPS